MIILIADFNKLEFSNKIKVLGSAQRFKMECMICRQRIESGERILWVSPVVFRGPEDSDVSYIEPSDGFQPAIHQTCLGNPALATKTLNTGGSEPVEEELVVSRSDALSLLGL